MRPLRRGGKTIESVAAVGRPPPSRDFAAFGPEPAATPVNWNKLQTLAVAQVETTLAALPGPLREQAKKLPVTFERVPNAGLQADGIEPDTLGLFAGPDFADADAVPMPPQIILFLENLWDFAGGDEKIFRDEVRATLLHELGHYLGLDEDDLAQRGLD